VAASHRTGRPLAQRAGSEPVPIMSDGLATHYSGSPPLHLWPLAAHHTISTVHLVAEAALRAGNLTCSARRSGRLVLGSYICAWLTCMQRHQEVGCWHTAAAASSPTAPLPIIQPPGKLPCLRLRGLTAAAILYIVPSSPAPTRQRRRSHAASPRLPATPGSVPWRTASAFIQHHHASRVCCRSRDAHRIVEQHFLAAPVRLLC